MPWYAVGVLPLRDLNPTQRAPLVTYFFIVANLVVFVYQFILLTPDQALLMVDQHGVVPAHLLSGYGPSLSTPFTSMFMHGGLAHLANNMWFLHVFGDNVEDVLGPARYFLFYVLTGVASAVAHALIDPGSQVPLVGASGAISGVLGAYILMFPRARVITFAFFLFEVPAFFFILFWFVIQVFSGFGALGSTQQTGVAFFAHIGGFVAGVLFVLAVGPRKPRPIAYLGPRVSTRQLRRRDF
jgi:membrane associated rhomboid family serine protease